MEDEQYKQAEIADRIGCADSTVSKARQALKDLPLPLVEKGRQRYSITDAGKQVLGLISQMIESPKTDIDIDLDSIDWHDDTEKAAVEALLAPLSNSHSTVPIFVMDALAERSGNGETLGTPPPVPVEQIICDVEMRRQERGVSTTAEQVRQTLRRFDDADVIALDGPDYRLVDKGQEVAWLLEQLVQLVEGNRETESSQSTPRAISNPETQQPSSSERTRSTPTTGNTDESISNANQTMTRGFFGGPSAGRMSETLNTDAPTTPSIVPAYCLLPSNDVSSDEISNSPSQFQAVLPMTQLTITELIEYAQRLASEYGDETQLASYWTLRTESGLYPLGPAELSLDDVSHQAWTVINDLWNGEERDAPSPNSEEGGSVNE
jgi:hypothetical protein